MLAVFAALALVVSVSGIALGATGNDSQEQQKSPWGDDGVRTREQIKTIENAPDPDDQHGASEEHLPASKENMKLVSKLKLTDLAGGIADVSYFRGFAYLAAWQPECPNGGVHIVDVRDPRNPVKVGFASSGPTDRPGEGVDVFHANTEFFEGDILLMNNEPCGSALEAQGGITLYDVTDPADPVLLSMGQGDRDLAEFGIQANAVHSVMGWQQDGKAYAVMTDNYEFEDVDIMDISNPLAPVLIRETHIGEWPGAEVNGNGNDAFHHDMWVKKIDGNWFLLVSYWDAGYVLLDINDPANPVFIDDSDYPGVDPLTCFSPPEGNAHQGIWSTDNKWILGADEDFSPYRGRFEISTGPNAGPREGGEFGWTVPIVENFRDDTMNGPTVWGGRACYGPQGSGLNDPPIPPRSSYSGPAPEAGEEVVVVLTRGGCFFSTKVENAQDAGYNAVLIGNSHAASAGGPESEDAFFCGGQGHEYNKTASAGCIGHRTMHLIFNDDPAFEGPDVADMPPLGTVGEKVAMASDFDGWGYLNLIDAETLEHVDAFAPEEALRQDFAHIFPLSIHETKPDPRADVPLTYAAWYQLGARVISFDGKLKERGHFIDKGGNDFWGTFPVKNGKEAPWLLFSDRDFGLYVLKYTGGGKTVNKGPCKGYAEGSRTRIGNGAGKVIVGTDGDDTLVGTKGKDIICGLGGNDVITGRDGKDIITGNGGNDIIDGGKGNDVISGGAGNDTLRGNKGRDTLRGGAGGDTLQGGRGDDILRGGSGHDTLKGHDGNDFLNGGPGTDTCSGGRGDDVVRNCERGPMEGGRRSPAP